MMELALLTGASAFGVAGGTWGSVADMSTPRISPGVTALNGTIYAVGGGSSMTSIYSSGSLHGECGWLKSGEAYNPTADTWSAIANMTSARAGMGFAALNGILYVVGGSDGGSSPLKSGEAYDPATDSWSAIANMSVPRNFVGLAALDGKLYAVGGRGGGPSQPAAACLKSGEVYDPVLDTWSNLPDMSTGRSLLGLAALDGKVFAVGGTPDGGTQIASVEAYDPATNSWGAVAPMSAGRDDLSAAALNGKIYAVGGFVTSSGEVYDLATDSWSALASMVSARDSLGLAVLNGKADVDMGKLFAVGGFDGATVLKSAEAFTPTAAFSCNSTEGIPRHGICVLDPLGNQTAEQCLDSCRCVVHNCGQLNGTVQCGAVLAGCNVCDSCCQSYFHQHSCDGCFAAPVSEQGCGGQ